MTAKTKTAAFIAAPANVPAVIPAHENKEFIAKLLDMKPEQQQDELLRLTMGEVSAIAAKTELLRTSCYAVLAKMMTRKHGEGWESRKFGGEHAPKTELEKQAAKELRDDEKVIFEMFKSRGYSNPTQAVKYVKDHASGKVGGAPLGPNKNKKKGTKDWLLNVIKVDNMWYRLSEAEDVLADGPELKVMDALAELLVAYKMNLNEIRARKDRAKGNK